jgi:nitrate reductase (cytochrome), electron transfer subunit
MPLKPQHPQPRTNSIEAPGPDRRSVKHMSIKVMREKGMKKIATVTITALSVLLYSALALSEVKSLRGEDLSAMAKNPQHMEIINAKGGFERSYKLQPPMVPHEVDKYEINLKVNECLSCHSGTTYEEKHAPKVGESHYESRDGTTQQTISSRRYFCNQCHAPQLSTDPLVQNKFQGAK